MSCPEYLPDWHVKREVQAYKIAPEVIKFHVTNYSILVSLLISQKLF